MKKSKKPKKANKIVRRYDKNKRRYFINKETGKREKRIIWEAQFLERGKRADLSDWQKAVKIINKNPKKFKSGRNVIRFIVSENEIKKKRNEALKDLKENKESYLFNYWEIPGIINDLSENQTILIKGIFGKYKKYEKNEALNLVREFTAEINHINLKEEKKFQKGKKKNKTKLYILIPFYENFDLGEAYIDFSQYENISTISDDKIKSLLASLID